MSPLRLCNPLPSRAPMLDFLCTRPPNATWIRSSASQDTNHQFKQPAVSDSSYQSRTSDVCQESEEEITEEEIRGRRHRGNHGHTAVSPRGPSARQRGLAAPEIRTSVSPDRILRRRRRIHRLGPRPDPPDIIDLRSDSEEPQSAGESMDGQPDHTPVPMSSSQSSSATLVTQPVLFIDLTRIPSASPRRRVPASASSQERVPRSQSLETSSSSRSTVRTQSPRSRRSFPVHALSSTHRV
ncbi:hypothetical protein K466DRAFT_156086 [Polyporus arcularius HHB13444]|uniref:Uncharacterized protein n=1 Tax=Polyporus arcularius HHB13444 TaxID=1314778 RepID=A0A5C3P9I6_9APHY|nr:hypothetical protein K466DRAFT_156086 [Polyporus arcularius HHB13444]